MKYIYPNNINELQDGDLFQIEYPLTDRWSAEKTYSSNICDDKKERIRHLIEIKKLRIVKEG